jgi:aminocarboxymuconate-semialdehyde decarboxylase
MDFGLNARIMRGSSIGIKADALHYAVPRRKKIPMNAYQPASQTDADSRLAKGVPRAPVVDFHAHTVMPEVLAMTYEQSLFAKVVQSKGPDGRAEPLPAAQMQRLTNAEVRLHEMDTMGIDMQVVSPSILHQCSYGLDERKALAIERRSNECVAEMVANDPDRLVGIGSVPLQNVDFAVNELERAVQVLGLKGAIVSSHVNGTELGDASLRPFWAKAQELGAAIFIHPAGNTDPRLARHRRLTSFGQQIEEAFALSSLVYDGVMDEFPKLKIVFAHGGGFLAYYYGRLDFFHRKGYSPQLKGDFSSYLGRFYYDTVVFDPHMLEALATKVPAGHILMGTDFPFAETDPVGLVRRARKLSRTVQDAILGANAVRLLGISL